MELEQMSHALSAGNGLAHHETASEAIAVSRR
jgi:hypothetical protein